MANLPGVSSSKDVGQGVPLTKRTLYSTSLGRILAKIDPANQAFWGFFLYFEQIQYGPNQPILAHYPQKLTQLSTVLLKATVSVRTSDTG